MVENKKLGGHIKFGIRNMTLECGQYGMSGDDRRWLKAENSMEILNLPWEYDTWAWPRVSGDDRAIAENRKLAGNSQTMIENTKLDENIRFGMGNSTLCDYKYRVSGNGRAMVENRKLYGNIKFAMRNMTPEEGHFRNVFWFNVLTAAPAPIEDFIIKKHMGISGRIIVFATFAKPISTIW